MRKKAEVEECQRAEEERQRAEEAQQRVEDVKHRAEVEAQCQTEEEAEKRRAEELAEKG